MRRFGLVLCLVVIGLEACGNTTAGPDEARFWNVHRAVCEAAAAAGAGDTGAAGRSFEDVHGPLHDLAAEAEERDRAAAAALLEAKNRVEDGLRRAGQPDGRGLEALASAVRRAIRATGAEAPPSCSR